MPSQPPSVYFSSSLFVFALYSKSESILSWSIQDKPVLGRGSTENKEGGRKTKNEKDAYGFRVCWSVKFMNVSAQHQWWKAYYSQVKIKYKKIKQKLIIIDSTCIIYHSWVQLQKKTEQVWLVCFLKKHGSWKKNTTLLE